MRLKRISDISGLENEIELPYSEEEFRKREKQWIDGMYIQDAFPECTDDQREFIMTGITEEEWKDLMCEPPSMWSKGPKLPDDFDDELPF